MKSLAAIFEGNANRLLLRAIRTPTPKAGEILVRVLGCTLCGSDLHSFEGRRSVAVPTVLGHEIVGEIVKCGDGITNVQVGDRVTWAIVASCRECFYCEHGLPQKCLRSIKYGHESLRPGMELLGGLAEHCLLTAGTTVVKLPDEMPLSVACPASCATATVAAALEAAGELQDRSVGIWGAGMLGLTACAMAHSAGARSVVVIDPEPGRRERALRFGAHSALSPEEYAASDRQTIASLGLDIAVELSGHPDAFLQILPKLRIGGTLVLVGSVFPSPPVPLYLEQVVRRLLTIKGVHNYAPNHLYQAVEFLSTQHGNYPFAGLVSEWYPLAQVEQAFARAADPTNIRVGVRMG